MANLVVDVTAPHRDQDEVAIVSGGKKAGGWENASITLRAEGFPPGFSFTSSSIDPDSGVAPALVPGNDCTIYIGDDVLITGYIDRLVEAGTADNHDLSVTGRGKTQDLVDCSAEWPAGLIQGNVLDIAQKLAEPYSIAVALGDGVPTPPAVPAWALVYGETGAEIIQRLARNAGLLAYEDARGTLILDRAGTIEAASGAAYGMNVQAWEAVTSMEDRVGSYVCTAYPVAAYSDYVGGASPFFFTATDPKARPNRKRYLPIEAVPDPQSFVKTKALWEAARNSARGAGVRVTIDAWRDKDGALWRPNTLLPVDVPGMTAGKLAISEVTFRRNNEEGTVAEIYALPPAGLMPEPLNLQPLASAGLHQ